MLRFLTSLPQLQHLDVKKLIQDHHLHSQLQLPSKSFYRSRWMPSDDVLIGPTTGRPTGGAPRPLDLFACLHHGLIFLKPVNSRAPFFLKPCSILNWKSQPKCTRYQRIPSMYAAGLWCLQEARPRNQLKANLPWSSFGRSHSFLEHSFIYFLSFKTRNKVHF